MAALAAGRRISPALLLPRPRAGPWLSEHVDMRERLNRGLDMTIEALREMTLELIARVEACGREHPIPQISAK